MTPICCGRTVSVRRENVRPQYISALTADGLSHDKRAGPEGLRSRRGSGQTAGKAARSDGVKMCEIDLITGSCAFISASRGLSIRPQFSTGQDHGSVNYQQRKALCSSHDLPATRSCWQDMESPSSLPRSLDTSPASLRGPALHPICSSHCWYFREIRINSNGLRLDHHAIAPTGKAMGICTVGGRISGSLRRPGDTWNLPPIWRKGVTTFRNRGGVGENQAPGGSSTCPIPTKRRAGKIDVDCGGNWLRRADRCAKTQRRPCIAPRVMSAVWRRPAALTHQRPVSESRRGNSP
jgi:hypothetical protein